MTITRSLAQVAILCGCSLLGCSRGAGEFAGTYQGVASVSSGTTPSLQSSVVITDSSGSADMTVSWLPPMQQGCAFDANISGDGVVGEMMPGGTCTFQVSSGSVTLVWSTGEVPIFGANLGMNLAAKVQAAPASSGLTAGQDLMISFNGMRSAAQ